MNFIKSHCVENYPDFCRFLLIDDYNTTSVLNFYQKNKFAPVFSTEQQERDAYKIGDTESLQTRYLFFDMIRWKDKSE
jgi:hypothetical protein